MTQTAHAVSTLKPGTVAAQSHHLGEDCGEPLYVTFRVMHRYATAYRHRFDAPLAEDYVLGAEYLKVITGARGLLNGDGAVAQERGITTDSKDNGVAEAMFWDCMAAAGFTEADL